MRAAGVDTPRSPARGLLRISAGRCRLCDRSGSALIELALIMPVFILILAGVADMARFTYASIEVSNAARAGAQYGIRNRGTAVDTPGMAHAAANDAGDMPSLKSTVSQYCVCTDGTSINCANAAVKCVSPARILQYVEVDTTTTLTPLFPYPGLPTTLTLKGHTTMRVQQ